MAGLRPAAAGPQMGTAEEVLAVAAQLTAAQAEALGRAVGSGSCSRWRNASTFCAAEAEAASSALLAADPARYFAASTDSSRATRTTAAHGRYSAVLAVQRTILALHAADLVDPAADRRGWSADAYHRLTSAWVQVIGPVPEPPAPHQTCLDLDGGPARPDPVAAPSGREPTITDQGAIR